jgi:hypothetical protein
MSSKGRRSSVGSAKKVPAAVTKPKKAALPRGEPCAAMRPSPVLFLSSSSFFLATAADAYIAKGNKLPRDENAPEGKISAYMFFSKAERARMAKLPKRQQMDFAEAGTAIGQAWSALSDAAKAPYVKEAEADAVRHDNEMAKYKPSAVFVALLEAAKTDPKYLPSLKKVGPATIAADLAARRSSLLLRAEAGCATALCSHARLSQCWRCAR